MKLLTIQPERVWNALQRTGVFTCDPCQRGYDTDFDEAYKWLSGRMVKLIGKPEVDGVTRPVWAWKYLDGELDAFDFDDYTHEEPAVALTLEIPSERVVLTDFDLWHHVLNNSPFFAFEDEICTEEEYDRRYDKAWKEYMEIPCEEREKVKVNSWDKCILSEGDNYGVYGNHRNIQATFWVLHMGDVVDVKHLAPNPSKW